MRAPQFSVGECVTHPHEEGNTGRVVRIERRGRVRPYWLYFVRWRPGVEPVPLRGGLIRVSARGAA